MTAPSLSSLLIENLRGAVTPFTLDFEKNRKLTIVYGENGTGKSTISDAFDLLGNDKVGSLDTRGLGVTRKYWHSVGKTSADVKVALETSDGSCVVSLGKNDVAVTNTALRPQVNVLRRNQILQLIEAKPAERYTAISRFVDVSGVENSESSLRSLIRTKDDEYNIAATRMTENKAEIERFWAQSGNPGSSAVAWAVQKIQEDQSHLDERKVKIDFLISLWDRLVAHPKRVNDLVNQLKTAEAAQQQSQDELNALKDSVTSDYLEVLAILKAAQVHFHKHPNPIVCPLCGSGEKVNGLVDEVNRRIQSQGLHSELEAAKEAAKTKSTVVQQARQRLNDSREAAIKDATDFEAYCTSSEVLAEVENRKTLK